MPNEPLDFIGEGGFFPTEPLAPDMEYLRAAYARGSGGFRTQLNANFTQAQQSDALIALDLPDWGCQRWSLVIDAMKYAGDAPASLVVLTGGVTPPPENQVDTSADYKIKIDYGAGGAAETVVLDYPTRGGAISFPASSVRVYCSRSPGSAAVPIAVLGGFIVPDRGTQRVALQPPCFTTLFAPVPASNSAYAIYPIPARAIGYRYVIAVANSGGGSFTFHQLRQGAATTVSVDVSPMAPATYLQATRKSEGPGNSLPWIPLHPWSEYIGVLDSTAGPSPQIAIQFVLDLG